MDDNGQLTRTYEDSALKIVDGKYKNNQTCPKCKLTKAERDQMTREADYDPFVEHPPRCITCDDGRRFGKKVTPPRLPGGVEGQEECCSIAPRWLSRAFGRGTRKRRGTKKRGSKKRGSKKRGSKKRGSKKRGSKKRGRSRKHHRGGKGCGSRKRMKKMRGRSRKLHRGGKGCGSRKRMKKMRGGSNAHLSSMAINSEFTQQQLAKVPPAGSGALAV